ncbi:MAG: hypothetical protein AAF197_09245 [Pseudomonadota bacterium]
MSDHIYDGIELLTVGNGVGLAMAVTKFDAADQGTINLYVAIVGISFAVGLLASVKAIVVCVAGAANHATSEADLNQVKISALIALVGFVGGASLTFGGLGSWILCRL